MALWDHGTPAPETVAAYSGIKGRREGTIFENDAETSCARMVQGFLTRWLLVLLTAFSGGKVSGSWVVPEVRGGSEELCQCVGAYCIDPKIQD